MDFKVPGPATHTFFSTFHLDDTCMFSQNILEKKVAFCPQKEEGHTDFGVNCVRTFTITIVVVVVIVVLTKLFLK